MTIIFQLNAACIIQTYHSKPDQPQPPDSTSKSDDDKEDDECPWIFKSPSGRVVTGKDLAFLK